MFGNIEENILEQAFRHKHKNTYWALQLRNLDGTYDIFSTDGTGIRINIHKAGAYKK